MAASQISTSVTIISSLLGFQAVTISGLGTSSAPTVMAGSKLEVAGAFFSWGTDETPNASSWTAISTGQNAYLRCTPSGSAGNQILTTDFSNTDPIWSTSKQGFYGSTGSSVRYFAALRKNGATSYDRKSLLTPLSQQVELALGDFTPILYRGTSGSVIFRYGISDDKYTKGLKTKVVQIGEWNMDATSSVDIVTGLSFDQIRHVSAIIISDAGTGWTPLIGNSISGDLGGTINFVGTTVTVVRTTGGYFDNSSFDATASTVANRGYVTITYEAGSTGDT